MEKLDIGEGSSNRYESGIANDVASVYTQLIKDEENTIPSKTINVFCCIFHYFQFDLIYFSLFLISQMTANSPTATSPQKISTRLVGKPEVRRHWHNGLSPKLNANEFKSATTFQKMGIRIERSPNRGRNQKKSWGGVWG